MTDEQYESLLSAIQELKQLIQGTSVEELPKERAYSTKNVTFTEVPEVFKGTPFDNLNFLNDATTHNANFKECLSHHGIRDTDEVLRRCLQRFYGEPWRISILRTAGREIPKEEFPEGLTSVSIEKLAQKVVSDGYKKAEDLVKERCEKAGKKLRPFQLGRYLEYHAKTPKDSKEKWQDFCRKYILKDEDEKTD